MATNKVAKKQVIVRRRPLLRTGSFAKTKRLGPVAILLVWATTLLISIASPLTTMAAPEPDAPKNTAPTCSSGEYCWLNAQTIQAPDGSHFLDDSPTDGRPIYFKQTTPLSCPNKPVSEIHGIDVSVDTIDIQNWKSDGTLSTSGHDLYTVIGADPNGYDTKCTLAKKKITIARPINSVLTYSWINKNLIRHFKMPVGDTDDMTYANRLDNASFTLAANGKYEYTNIFNCKATITPDAGNPYLASLVDPWRNEAGNCEPQKTYRIRLAFTSNATVDGSPAAGNNNENGGNAQPPKSCETKSAANVIGWLLCGFINVLDGAINEFDKQLQNLLVVDMSYFTDQKFVDGWGVIRNISLLALVPIMLIMVIATALEIGPFDAYTVRKMLPRFLIAVIFIVLSLPILKFFIHISNIAETGLLGLMTSVFGQDVQRITLQSLFNPTEGQAAGIFASLVTGGVVGVSSGGVTMGVVFSFALVAVVAALLAYIAFQVRIILLVGITLLAPLLAAAWIFDPKNKATGFGKDTFVGLLAVGPALVVLIGAGRMLAYMSNTWWLKLGFYIGVYFLMLYVIRSFSAIMAAISDKGKGFFQAQQKFRAGSRQKAWSKFKAGERGPGLVKKAGFTTGAFLEAEKKFRFAGSAMRNSVRVRKPKTGYYGQAISQQHKLNEMRYAQTERAKATQEDDGFMLQALTYRNAAEARQRMSRDWGASKDDIDRSIAAANATGGFSAARQNFATRQLARTGTGYQNIDQMQATVARVAGNNQSMAADMLGEMNATTKGAGRHDLAAGFGNQLEMYRKIQERGGYDKYVKDGGTQILTADEYRQAHLQAAKDVDAVTLLRDKKTAVKNMSEAVGQSFNVAQQAAIDARAIMNDPTVTPEQRTAATAEYKTQMEEVARLTGYMNKIEQSGTYASVTNVDVAYDQALTPTSGIGKTRVQNVPGGRILTPTDGRMEVASQASNTKVAINPVTGKMEAIPMTRTVVDKTTGKTTTEVLRDPVTGNVIYVPNPNREAAATEMMRRHGPGSQGMDPNNPNYN